MNLIILCLSLGLSSILSADDVSSSIVSEMKHPGYWPEPFYPPNAEPGWGYPPRPPPYLVDFNERIEGNLFF
jgi:hypothetical protein